MASDTCTYTVLGEQLTERFREKLPAQYHYTKLQDATQDKGDSVEEFADRCRKLCQKTVRTMSDEVTQKIINEEAERRLVAAYINGLGGMVGQQVRFKMPNTLDEAVQVAITISNAERTKTPDTKRVFSARREGIYQSVVCFNCGKRGHYARECRMGKREGFFGGNGRARNMAGGRRQGAPGHVSRNSSTPMQPNGKTVRCYHCKKLGHRRDQCPLLANNTPVNPPPNTSGSAMRSQKSTQMSQASH